MHLELKKRIIQNYLCYWSIMKMCKGERQCLFVLSNKSWILQKCKKETQQLYWMNRYTIMPRVLYTAVFSYQFSSQNMSEHVIYCPPPNYKNIWTCRSISVPYSKNLNVICLCLFFYTSKYLKCLIFFYRL